MTTLNVTDYGAAGDGRTDDRQAIQDAIDDAADGDTVYVPSGTYLVGDGGSGGHGIVIETSVANITIEGDGSETKLTADDVADDYQLVRINAFDGTIDDLTIRKMVLDTRNDVNTRSGGVGYAAVHVNNNNQETTGHSIHFEDLRMQNVAGAGLIMRGGLETVTGRRLTVVDTKKQHGFQFDSVDNPSSESNIANTFRSIRVEETGEIGVSKPGNAFNINGSVLLEDVFVRRGYRGTKISNGGLLAVMRNVRFTEHNDMSALRGPTNSSSNSLRLKLDNVTFQNSDRQSLNAFNNAGDWTIEVPTGSAIETVNCNRGGDDLGHYDVRDNVQLDIDTMYVDGGSSPGLYFWADLPSTVDTINANDVDAYTDSSGNLTVNEVNTSSAAPGLGTPTASDVGAFTGSSDGGSTSDSFDAWAPRWTSTTDDWGVVSDGGYEGGNALAFESTSGRGRHALSWEQVGTPADVEALDKFRVPSFADNADYGFHARSYLRASTTNGNTTGYWVEAEAPQDSFRLGKYNADGSLTTLARFGTPAENVFYYRRFRAEGETLRAKVWPADQIEPDGWDVEVTDADHASGWVGVGAYDPEFTETDVLSVGTGGASADASPADDPPTITWVDPADGETVSGGVAVGLDASDPKDADDSLTVEYQVDGGAWTTAGYDTDAGLYTTSWDSTGVADGDHTLSARATDGAGNTAGAAVGLTVANDLAVETVSAESVGSDAATLVGDLTSLGDSTSATGVFEYRERGADTWTAAGEQTLGSTGRFDTEVTGLSADTGYEFRAVATADDRDAGAAAVFDTTAGSTSSLSIDQFEVTDNSNPAWSRFDIDWAVSDADGDLNTVVTELRYGGVTVAAESSNVTGSTASHSHELRVKGDVDEIWLGVNDSSNEIVHESKSP